MRKTNLIADENNIHRSVVPHSPKIVITLVRGSETVIIFLFKKKYSTIIPSYFISDLQLIISNRTRNIVTNSHLNSISCCTLNLIIQGH